MNLVYFYIVILYVFLIQNVLGLVDPITLGVVGASLGSYYFKDSLIKYTYCQAFECCNEKYLTGDFTGLKKTLDAKLYGQHLVKKTVVNALKNHFSEKEPKKALTLSFHGWTGCGKNYVTNFVKKALYKKGEDSKFVHHFTARIHFPLEGRVEEYKRNLQNWIKGNISNCERSLFVFDDVHLMPKGILNAISPILDYNDKVDNIDCRKAVFIFLSNTGGTVIKDHLLSMWEQGIKREDIELHDFESLILKGAFNEEGGFQHSEAIKSHVIDHFIPFLPMGKEYVRLCIIDFFRIKKVEPSEVHIEEVMKHLEWGPEPINIFSLTGCKRIHTKVPIIIEKYGLR